MTKTNETKLLHKKKNYLNTINTTIIMSKISLTFAIATLCWCGLQCGASTKTVMYFENFDDEGAGAYSDGTSPETSLGSIPSLWSTGGESQGGTGDGQWLYKATTVNGVDGLGFGLPGSHYNWADGVHADAIKAAGGFSIKFKQNSNNNTSPHWSCIRVGSGPENGNFVSADLAVLTNFNGTMATYDGNSGEDWHGTAAEPGSYQTTTYDIELKFEFTEWDAGHDVTFTGILDGNTILTDIFQWNKNDDVKIVFAGHRSGFWIDDIEISYTTPIPVASSLGFMLPVLCITFLFAFRRPCTVGIL